MVWSNALRFKGFLLPVIIMAWPVLVWGQQGKPLTPGDYGQWSTVILEQLSDKGKWASFQVSYETGGDTLEVRSTDGLKRYCYPRASHGSFIGERWFACIASGSLLIQDLENGEMEKVLGVTSFSVSGTSKHLMYRKAGDGIPNLIVREIDGPVVFEARQCVSFHYSPEANAIAFITVSPFGEKLAIYNLGNAVLKHLGTLEGLSFKKIVWHQDGRSIAYIAKAGSGSDVTDTVGYYDLPTGRLYWFLVKDSPSIPSGHTIVAEGMLALTISDDGRRVFFTVRKMPVPSLSGQVQVWNTSDKLLYPNKALSGNGEYQVKLVMWIPQKDVLSVLNDPQAPQVYLNGNKSHAISFNGSASLSDGATMPLVDYYLHDFNSGDKALVLQNYAGASSGLQPSPGGKYLTYFLQGHWWCYNIASGKHYNLTGAVPCDFAREDYDYPGTVPAYPVAGWSSGDRAVFLYDAYDIWMVALDGSWIRKITNGRRSGTRYRLVPQGAGQKPRMNYEGSNIAGVFDTSDWLLLRSSGPGGNGYSIWAEGQKVKEIVKTAKRCSQAVLSVSAESILYMEEHFNSPPCFHYKAFNKVAKVVFQSNPQHYKFQWGRSEVFSFTTASHGTLKAALFYPAGYDPSRQYPMVVYIYEKESNSHDLYVNPSELNSGGFNITNLTSQGYLVLAPDIHYTFGSPGLSALDCVTSATRAAIRRASVDPKKIGLIGGSFGGYETSFIITQTDMFAAAVAGAGITDLISNYFYVSWNFGVPNFWRFERGQMRMGLTPFEDYGSYLENSPIYHADKICTPLLSWSGEEDYQVHYYQSMELHLALRRLHKKNVLFLYPGEGHFLSKPDNQRHCTRSTEQWFAHYLKGEEEPCWAR